MSREDVVHIDAPSFKGFMVLVTRFLKQHPDAFLSEAVASDDQYHDEMFVFSATFVYDKEKEFKGGFFAGSHDD